MVAQSLPAAPSQLTTLVQPAASLTDEITPFFVAGGFVMIYKILFNVDFLNLFTAGWTE